MWRAIILGICALLLDAALLGQSTELLVRQAQEDIRTGHYSQAEQELSRAAQANPADWKLWNNLGVLRIQLGENASAIKAFEKARGAAPQQAPPFFGLGVAYMKTSDFDKAEEAYRAGLARDPSDVAANQNYAYLLTQNGDFRDAVEPLKRLKSLQPGNVSARATLIEAYLKAGMKNEGEIEVSDFLNAHIAKMPEELSLAKVLIADRNPEAAARVLENAAATWPDAAEPHGDLGLLYIRGGQYEPAVRELGRAAQIDPDSAKYSLGVAEALLRWRHDGPALQFLTAIQPKFAALPLYKFELGLAYYYLTRFPEALQEFEGLAQEQPRTSQIQYLLGGTYEELGQLDKAEACFRKAIALKPDAGQYYQVLAALLKKVHPADLAEPISLSERGLALNPDNEDLKLLLASCYQAQGKLAEAQGLLEALVNNDPDFRAAHVALAQVYFRQRRLQDAEKQESIAARLEDRKQSEVSPWGPGGVEGP
jgi:Flp pilus assembly protein TadD